MRQQIDEGFCGPAVLQHLLYVYGFDVSQEEIANAVSSIDSVKKDGMSPEGLALAVKSLVPDLDLWVKRSSSWEDVETLSSVYSMPYGNGVVLDIQGVFVDNDVLVPGAVESVKLVTGPNESQTFQLEEQLMIKKATEEDNGHYVIVTGVYKNGQVRFIDPSFNNHPRYLHQNIIQMRWWDINIGIDRQLMFVVTWKNDLFPPCLEMGVLS